MDRIARRRDNNLNITVESVSDHGLTGAAIIGAVTEKAIDRVACRAQIRKSCFIINMLCRQ